MELRCGGIHLEGEYYTTQQAARAVGLTPGRIRQLVCEGRLPVIAVGGKANLIQRRQLLPLLEKSHTGRPRSV